MKSRIRQDAIVRNLRRNGATTIEAGGGGHNGGHMKFGPARDYWNEFVFEAYVNHQADAIFLAGLPDVPESRPHARRDH